MTVNLRRQNCQDHDDKTDEEKIDRYFNSERYGVFRNNILNAKSLPEVIIEHCLEHGDKFDQLSIVENEYMEHLWERFYRDSPHDIVRRVIDDNRAYNEKTQEQKQRHALKILADIKNSKIKN